VEGASEEMAIRCRDDHHQDQEGYRHPGAKRTEAQVGPNPQDGEGSEEAELDPPGGEEGEDHLRYSFVVTRRLSPSTRAIV
jgi:hypothetical protein